MKKASKIILIIAGVFGVISITAAVIFAVIFFIAPSVPELQAAIADGLLSILIFHHLNKSAEKTREKDGETFNLLKSFKKSSLFILSLI